MKGIGHTLATSMRSDQIQKQFLINGGTHREEPVQQQHQPEPVPKLQNEGSSSRFQKMSEQNLLEKMKEHQMKFNMRNNRNYE